VMCTGMVHPELVVHALSKGADGVIVMGWHPGECHYLDGNHKALARVEAVRTALEIAAIDPCRFDIAWSSSAEAPRFAHLVSKFTEEIRKLGPNPIRQTVLVTSAWFAIRL